MHLEPWVGPQCPTCCNYGTAASNLEKPMTQSKGWTFGLAGRLASANYISIYFNYFCSTYIYTWDHLSHEASDESLGSVVRCTAADSCQFKRSQIRIMKTGILQIRSQVNMLQQSPDKTIELSWSFLHVIAHFLQTPRKSAIAITYQDLLFLAGAHMLWLGGHEPIDHHTHLLRLACRWHCSKKNQASSCRKQQLHAARLDGGPSEPSKRRINIGWWNLRLK